MTNLPNNVSPLINAIIKGIQDVKGKDIVCLDLKNIHNRVCEYFIVCHGDSTTQVKAIAESIEKETWLSIKEDARHKEGKNNAEWVLLDYFNVVIHIFHKDKREYYNLENLWADAIMHEIEEPQMKVIK